jgi:hypothetical protein
MGSVYHPNLGITSIGSRSELWLKQESDSSVDTG